MAIYSFILFFIMKTKLLEFKNSKGQNIRGIATIPDGEIKEIIICLH
jgi:hypothetical protein